MLDGTEDYNIQEVSQTHIVSELMLSVFNC